jgi:hypothetical protein
MHLTAALFSATGLLPLALAAADVSASSNIAVYWGIFVSCRLISIANMTKVKIHLTRALDRSSSSDCHSTVQVRFHLPFYTLFADVKRFGVGCRR